MTTGRGPEQGRFAPRRREVLTVALMVAGYAGYYLCRSDLSVALPLLIDDMRGHGIPASVATVRLGAIASFGVLAYALGKFVAGGLADSFGGKRNFLLGMGGSVLFTLLFSLAGGIPLFTLAWIGNRLVQSLGWAGMVKVTSKWFSHSVYGTVMGIISVSFLFGDAASRQLMSVLIASGLGWRGVFRVAAATLAVLWIACAVLLRESPTELGYDEPPQDPANAFAASGKEPPLQTVMEFLRMPGFWLVCLLSLGLTLLRETFNLWTPTYFTQALGLTDAAAAGKSALFPLFGGISVIVAGFLSDRLGSRGRATIVLAGLLLTAVALLVLGVGNFGTSAVIPVCLVALIGFVMIGPYSFFAGAISLDLGGKDRGATASGLIDGVGYLGGVLSGGSVASISVVWGWKGAFLALAGVALASAIAAGLYLKSLRAAPGTRGV